MPAPGRGRAKDSAWATTDTHTHTCARTHTRTSFPFLVYQSYRAISDVSAVAKADELRGTEGENVLCLFRVEAGPKGVQDILQGLLFGGVHGLQTHTYTHTRTHARTHTSSFPFHRNYRAISDISAVAKADELRELRGTEGENDLSLFRVEAGPKAVQDLMQGLLFDEYMGYGDVAASLPHLLEHLKLGDGVLLVRARVCVCALCVCVCV